MPESLTPLQEYYLSAIQLGLVLAAVSAVLIVFTCGFIIVRGMGSN